jgi:hypothetical protein
MMPKSVADAIERWDRGEPITTVEMGGFGPGYEQAIQAFVVEILRDANDANADGVRHFNSKGRAAGDAFRALAEKTLSRVNEHLGGITGMQFGAALELAFMFHRDGWKKVIKTAPRERIIQVSTFWPRVPR